jgi:hypothetical protein
MTTTGNANIQMKNLDGRVGSYAISTIDFNSWANEPVAVVPQRAKKTRGTKEIVYKIFADYALMINDPFWVDKFNTAAMGKLPPKFNYHDGMLTYKKGAKSNSLDISNNSYDVAHACMEFFRSNGGIFSPMDEQISLELQYSRAQIIMTQQLTWGDANKKVQDCMLSYYVTDMKQIMTLTNLEVEQLRQTIKLGIANKYFGKHNIRVENNRIHSVDGLLWNNETRSFYVNPELKPNTTRSYSRKKDGPTAIDPSQKDMIPQFGIKWVKYIESLDKKIARYNRHQRRIIINHPGVTAPHVRHLQLVTTTTATSRTDATDATSVTSRTDASTTDDE